jgi:hypothetical protein
MSPCLSSPLGGLLEISRSWVSRWRPSKTRGSMLDPNGPEHSDYKVVRDYIRPVPNNRSHNVFSKNVFFKITATSFHVSKTRSPLPQSVGLPSPDLPISLANSFSIKR